MLERRAVSGIMLTLLVVSMLTLAFNIQPAKAGGTIYIRADGSVEGTTDISSADYITYTFKDNIYDEIVIERSDITIDGSGYTMQGTGVLNSKGIYLFGISNVTIENTNIEEFSVGTKGFHYGIYLESTSYSVISENNITAPFGIYLIKSSGNKIYGNEMRGGWEKSSHDYSLSLSSSHNNTISGNKITNNWHGVRLMGSHNNTVSDNEIKSNTSTGVYLDGSKNNTISRNNIKMNNWNGIRLRGYKNNNTISENNIMSNENGIYLEGATYNLLYHNNFQYNTKQVNVGEGYNNWDDGYPSGGNYWSDYTGVDADGDGMGDTPYIIDENNQDNYPLMNPWTPSEDGPVTPTPPEVQVGVEAGDWIKCDYTVSGWPSGTPYPEWLKVEILSVEGTTATVKVALHMSDGPEQSDTVNVDVATGSGTFQGLSGFVIPANSKIGDTIYMSGYGNVTLDGETTRTYAGASRAVVYASFSQFGTELTYYWDKETGVMVEASTTAGGMTGTAKATETNMWEAAPTPFRMQWWLIPIVAVAIVALVGVVYFLKKRKAPTPTAPILSPEQGETSK